MGQPWLWQLYGTGKLGKAAFSHGFSACGIEQVTETSTILQGTLPTSDVQGKALLLSCTPPLWVWLLQNNWL